jgi:hypothetical protein
VNPRNPPESPKLSLTGPECRLIQLHVASGAKGVPSSIALIFGNVSDDSMLQLQSCVDLCKTFARAGGRSGWESWSHASNVL